MPRRMRPWKGSPRPSSRFSTSGAASQAASPRSARTRTTPKNRHGNRSRSCSARRKRAQHTGDTVRDTKYDANIASAALTASGVNRYLPMPSMNISGRNTTTVVIVAISTGTAISLALSRAASTGDLPMFRCRTVFSTSTIESSTTRPSTKASPPSVMMLSVCPVRYRPKNAASTDSGIDNATIQVLRRLPRNSSTTSDASTAPPRPSMRRLYRASRTYCDWSKAMATSTSAGTVPRSWNCGRNSLTLSTTRTALAPAWRNSGM